MKKITSSIVELMPKNTSLQEFIARQARNFDNRFGAIMPKEVEIELEFECQDDAHEFYNEVRYNAKYAQMYTLKTNRHNPLKLWVSGSTTLFDYFGTREPNLLTVSRVLDIGFKIDYIQAMSGIVFTGEVVRGELLGRHCIIEVSDILPELALGGLRYIAKNMDEFDALLTRVYCVQGQRIV